MGHAIADMATKQGQHVPENNSHRMCADRGPLERLRCRLQSLHHSQHTHVLLKVESSNVVPILCGSMQEYVSSSKPFWQASGTLIMPQPTCSCPSQRATLCTPDTVASATPSIRHYLACQDWEIHQLGESSVCCATRQHGVPARGAVRRDRQTGMLQNS